jgi:hypothetical protein
MNTNQRIQTFLISIDVVVVAVVVIVTVVMLSSVLHIINKNQRIQCFFLISIGVDFTVIHEISSSVKSI